jgi:hypothetical protein
VKKQVLRDGWVMVANNSYDYWRAEKRLATIERKLNCWQMTYYTGIAIRHTFEDMNASRDFVQRKVEYKLKGHIV